MWNESGVIVAELSMRHPQRSKDIFCSKVFQRLPAHPLHDYRKQEVSGVAVLPVGTRRKRHALLPDDDAHRIIIRCHVVGVDTGQEKQRWVVPHATSVVQQPKNSYLL